MYLDDYAFRKELLTHKVYSSWQFITFTRKNKKEQRFERVPAFFCAQN